MPRTHPSVSSTLSVSLCLAISYALILTTLCAPFAIRTAEAATRSSNSSAKAAKTAPTLSSSLAARTAKSSPSKASSSGNNKSSGHRDSELIVRFRATTSEADKTSIVESRGAHRNKKLRGESNIEKLIIPANQDAESLAAELRTNPNIEFVEPNYLVSKDDTTPNDPSFAQQWALHNSLNAAADINVMPAWDTTTGSSSTVIAVIDSGIDFTHPDLVNNEWTNTAEKANNNKDDDHDGFIDDVHGWDYIADNPAIKDEQGHGTAIAGIIASEGNNRAGTSGVMWHASLMSLRVLDNTGGGDVASAVEAIDYAAAHGASVINLSWGTDAQSTALSDAIERAGRRGVVVVCSAGNGGRDVESTPYYPASFGLPNMVSVAATNNSDQLTSWSNYGQTHVTIAAPGVDIQTTKMNGGYWTVSGTSASAPLVSGVAGLIKTVRPQLSSINTVQAIASSARQVSALTGKVSAGGVVNAMGAIAALQSITASSSANNGNNGNGGGNTSNGNNNANNGNGNNHPSSPPSPPPAPQQHGTGGQGPDGSFNVEPPARTKGSPLPNLPNIDALRKLKPTEPKAPPPIPSKHRPYSHADDNVVKTDTSAIHADSVTTNAYTGSNLSIARLDAGNRTGTGGEDLFSGNFNWSVPLVSLAGRSGLDLDLGLSYNSLVWTKAASNIYFDADSGSPSPGFRLGLPVVQSFFYNGQAGSYAYMLVTASGARVELRQLNGSNVYTAQDSSNLRLVDYGNYTLALWTPDGTRYAFASIYGQYQCTEIKDKNGNFISVNYNGSGRIANIVDTLSRIVNFNYDGYANLISITQTWNGQTHQWATFGYGVVYIQPGFSGVTSVGPNNMYITALTQVGFGDGSRYNFEYNSYGQVSTIRHYAPDGSQRSYVSYALPSSASDCPRVTERHDWVRDWNNGNEAITYYGVEANDVQVVTFPDNTVHKEFFNTAGWARGLNSRTEEWAGGTIQKWTTTDWTQDNINAGYQINPRPTDTNIYDNQGNRKRTHIDYASYSLPSDIYEYEADAATVKRRTHIDYTTDTAYLDRRLLLMTEKRVYDGAGNAASIVLYRYDWSSHLEAMPGNAAPTQHDASYDTNFTARGNLVSVQTVSVDPNDPPNSNEESKWGYNTAGEVTFTRDMLWHQQFFSYADNFSDGANRNTFAYPTTVTDPDWNQSTAQYNYDMGAVTRAQDPKGAVALTSYDGAGRVQQVTNAVNNAYTRFNYGGDSRYVETYATVQEGAGEAYKLEYFDGVGRSFATIGAHPGSAGGYRTQINVYDVMGRLYNQSNPTEMNGAWTVTGDDAANGWVWNNQAFDWKGRPTIATHADGTTTQNTYGGCGCAGGEVVTSRDEMGRRVRATADTLGRVVKAEVLNWDQSVYTTTTTSYNVRDQVTRVFEEAGTPGSSGTGQETLLTYDGYGRLKTKKTPIENAASSYVYNADDTVRTSTDARGVVATFTYNNRHLTTGITYSVPAGASPAITATGAVNYDYDAAGNRMWMTDGAGRVDYSYDTLSRLQSESRQFNGLSGTYTLSYNYNLGGELKTITDPSGASVGYTHDVMGQLTDVSGTASGQAQTYASNMQYRAFGALKAMTYGNGTSLALSYNGRGQLTHYAVGGVTRDGQYGALAHGADVVYYDDGRVKYAADLFTDALVYGNYKLHDRAYSYDQAGRLTESYSGWEANQFMTGTGSGVTGAYRQSYAYDVWGNTTSRTGRFWTADDNDAEAYDTRGRNTAWEYDASGRFVSRNEAAPDTSLPYQPLRRSYDAAGQLTVTTQMTSARSSVNQNLINTTQTTRIESYDGDGVGVKQATTTQRNTGQPITATTYYLRSSVLGAAVIAEYDGAGTKQNSYVYAGNERIARQSGSVVFWQQTNPTTGDEMETDVQGVVTGKETIDPVGVNVGDSDPFDPPSGGGGSEEGISQQQMNSRYAQLLPPSLGGGAVRTYVDGFETTPMLGEAVLSSGAGVLSSFRSVIAKYGSNGKGQLLIFGTNPRTGAMGYFGYTQTSLITYPNSTAEYDEQNHLISGRDGDPVTTIFDRQQYFVPVDAGFSSDVMFIAAGYWRPQTPGSIWGNDWNKLRNQGVSLSPCAQKILSDLFSASKLNVKDLRVRVGIPQSILDFAKISPAAVTLGNDIYLDAGSIDRFDARTVAGLANLAHEAWHALQYANGLTKAGYLKESAAQAAKGKDSYWDNKYEKEAYEVQDMMKEYIKSTYGDDPCGKLGLSPVAK